MAKKKKKKVAGSSSSKSRAPRFILLGLSALALGFGTYMGIRYYKRRKSVAMSNNTTSPSNSATASSQSKWRDDSFPLNLWSSGPKVLQLQRKLNAKYDAELEEDGLFGPVTKAAVLKFGFKVPITASEFSKMTDGEATLVFDPKSIAEGLWKQSNARDITGTVTALRQIKNIDNYKSVNTYMQSISNSATGVRRTIVNHLLTYAFSSSEAAKVQLRAEFLRIGLVESNGKWALAGLGSAFRRLITVRETLVKDSAGNRIKVKSGTLLGHELSSQGAMTAFEAVDGTKGVVAATHVRYI